MLNKYQALSAWGAALSTGNNHYSCEGAWQSAEHPATISVRSESSQHCSGYLGLGVIRDLQILVLIPIQFNNSIYEEHLCKRRLTQRPANSTKRLKMLKFELEKIWLWNINYDL